MLHTASFEQIKNGEVVDEYFNRTRQILEAKGINPVVRAEFMAKGLPKGWQWGVLAGLEEALPLIDDLGVKLRVMPEGTIFRAYEPVLEIEGRYLDFGQLETAILGLLCQASGVATMAARCRKAAGDKPMFSFGARRIHPAVAPMAERNAFIGGCDDVAVGMGAALAGRKPVGTMPHALILIMGDTVEATLAFDEVIDPEVNRVSLIDTFQDEKFEAVRVAKALGDKLWGIRLDTPGSRRGDFIKIIDEVRWELDLAGYRHVKIVVSGGLDETTIPGLAPYVDAFGVGTAISNPPVVDFSMDIVEIAGKPIAKRGQKAGVKEVFRCPRCYEDVIVPQGQAPKPCICGGEMTALLGSPPETLPRAESIRSFVLEQLERFDL